MSWADRPLPFPRARQSDPVTSHAAAASLDDRTLGLQQFRVLKTISRFVGAATRDDVASVTGSPAANVSRRITDLCQLGLVRDSGVTRPGWSGRQQTVWEITPDGYKALTEANR